jgi:aminopeptidase N
MRYLLIGLIISFYSFNIFSQEAELMCQQSKIKSFDRLMKANGLNYPGDQNYDVKYYKLDLALTYIPQSIKGAVTVNGVVTSNNVTSIYLDLTSPLIVDSVKLNGNLTSFNHQEDEVTIELNSIYNIGDAFSLIVYYHGIPGSSGFGSFTFGTTPTFGSPVIYTLSEPYGSKDWWPCKDTPADKADSADIWITVANNFIAASNGKLIEVLDNGNNTQTYKWKVSYPIAQYLISLAITNYTEYVNYYNYSATDSMPIHHYIYPETFNSSVQAQLDKTPLMIKAFAKYFGEYPFIKEKYGHAQFGWGGGMEHQTITSMGGFSDDLIAHELAHQWYGDAVTCKDWENIWVNEGFATYAQGVWKEYSQGKIAYNNYINSIMGNAKSAKGSIWVEDISSVNNIFNYSRTYAKAGTVLHMLRGVVGDSVFFDILRTYTYHPSVSYNVANTEDFQAIAEQVSGLNLNYFFQQWIYGYDYPKYSVVWNKNSLGGNLWDLSIRIIQQVNSNPSFFTMPIQIKVNTGFGDSLITVFNDAQIQNFNVTINGEPNSISFDPNNWILKDVSSILTGVTDGPIPISFSLEQNYPNPFNPGTKISWQSPVAGWQILKVYDLLGNEVATLVNEEKPAGVYEVNFDASSLSSGVYIYRITISDKLKTGEYVSSKKMILMK